MPVNRQSRLAAALLAPLLWFALFISSPAAVAADAVGEVTFVQGVASAQRPGEGTRFLAKGEALHEGETLNTGAKSFALIALKDGTRLTLRPNTSFTLETFRHGDKEESAIFRLVKGGVRTLTGLVSKRNPQGMEMRTPSATIGIRGTSFDARICDADCAEDQRRMAGKTRLVQPEMIVARVAVLAGSASAIGTDGQTRALNEGGALFSGDSVRTAKGSYAVLGFRDRSKVTVVADSEFKLEDVRFTGAQSDTGNFAVRVVRGGIRALTGLLARRDPKSVSVGAGSATIGIRGTGFDAALATHCVSAGDCADATQVHVWEPAAELRVGDRVLEIQPGQVGVFVPGRNLLAILETVPPVLRDETAPRPDSVEIDFTALFGAVQLDTGAGVYVSVRDGDVVLRGPEGFIYLSRDEAGVLQDGRGLPVRITPPPRFMLNDPIPLPDAFNESSARLLDVLNPGEVICEIR